MTEGYGTRRLAFSFGPAAALIFACMTTPTAFGQGGDTIVTAPLVRQDFSDCSNGNVTANNPALIAEQRRWSDIRMVPPMSMCD